uniref:Putative secreted protein n=1 Tax=Ixodes ricinus TaxID=34613 RepID=A0A6B0UDI7_IXORI
MVDVGLRLRFLPFLRNIFILLEVGEEVHGERVLLVELVTIGHFYRVQCTLGVLVLQEHVPFRLPRLIHGYKLCVDLPKLGIDLHHNILELF